MKPSIKIPWKLFVELALEKVREGFPVDDTSTPKFMKTYGSEGDGEAYDLPEYVEVELIPLKKQ